MTLKEAIESGKLFKHKSWVHFKSPTQALVFSAEDILDDNWEIKDEPRRWRIPIAALDGWTEQAAMDLLNGDDHFDYVEVVEVER